MEWRYVTKLFSLLRLFPFDLHFLGSSRLGGNSRAFLGSMYQSLSHDMFITVRTLTVLDIHVYLDRYSLPLPLSLCFLFVACCCLFASPARIASWRLFRSCENLSYEIPCSSLLHGIESFPSSFPTLKKIMSFSSLRFCFLQTAIA